MTTAPDLPSDVRRALDNLSHGVSRNAIAERAAAQSATFRAGGGSQAIATRDDALAYAFARMPATYAAVISAIDALRSIEPTFAPRTMLDVGAGPATAAFAAAQVFAQLDDIRLVDANAALRDLAIALMADADNPVLRCASYQQGDALKMLDGAASADLVIASYMAGELAASEREQLAQRLWNATAGALVVIEPGTPAGYACILGLRTTLIAAGAHVAAPCPHERACPLIPPDWCHFSRRLPRLRDHLRVKAAEVPFEDEKFSYLALTRTAPRRIDARVLAPPEVRKSAIRTKLCTGDGLAIDVAPRRDTKAYRARRAWRWGDEVKR
jgi:ribosomal protein RSM22 (predicted rRNA methylase)